MSVALCGCVLVWMIVSLQAFRPETRGWGTDIDSVCFWRPMDVFRDLEETDNAGKDLVEDLTDLVVPGVLSSRRGATLLRKVARLGVQDAVAMHVGDSA